MSSPALLVTGAAGFIAFHVIESLLRSGNAVIGVDSFDPLYDRSLKERNIADLKALAATLGTSFSFLELDICTLPDRFQPDTTVSDIIHLAAKVGVRPSLEDPEGYLRVNAGGTLRLLEFARKRGISRLILGSSSSVYGEDTPTPFSEEATAARPVSPYAASKRAAELMCWNYCHAHRLTIAALRFFTVYGPRQRPDLVIHKFCKQIAEGKPVTMYGDGATERDYTYVTDIVEGVHGALNWARSQPAGTFELYNIGGSRPIPLMDLISRLETLLRAKAKINRAPLQAGDVQRTYADIRKAARDLGYRPRTTLEDGLGKFVEWFLGSRTDLTQGKAA